MMSAHDSTGDLFAVPRTSVPAGRVPLAERLRPRHFDDLVGQDDVVGTGRPLRQAIEQDRLSSVIFWGPPGCGKTTLAGLVAQYTKSQFVPFSAVKGFLDPAVQFGLQFEVQPAEAIASPKPGPAPASVKPDPEPDTKTPESAAQAPAEKVISLDSFRKK